MSAPLEGRVVALAESRQLEELAQMLEKEGATPLRYPLVAILDPIDPGAVVEWLLQLVAGKFDYVVFMTGEGVRRLLDCAAREGMRDEVLAGFARTKAITRGPKPLSALKAVGLFPYRTSEAPTTDGVIATLRKESLRGKSIGVQFYCEPNPALCEFVHSMGAECHSVQPYAYAPASDAERVESLIREMAKGSVDVLVLTSSPQVRRLYEVATANRCEAELRSGLQKTQVAAVGPVVAETLREHGSRVDICPEQGFVMKNLVNHIKRAFSR